MNSWTPRGASQGAGHMRGFLHRRILRRAGARPTSKARPEGACRIGRAIPKTGAWERRRPMNLEKFTERSRGFLQAAQTIAAREHHQRILPHMLD